ncbi:thioredoxin domain-containing protein [Novosphingobium cyanobacteriorum]|uniref:Thioredoxin domain-containing protein n=1 Tax=Novosphingobium cyanobacteriorum TaxID=3024215 RepID=A0ABT6CH09_9SPHN|nr:thioredoxin domain-containing protein [Novosphingobium cyanobacteriorum]MDF8332568.1 thioredoxin domain-containing protein [Novosphingobium cyanobacteriorum]
MTLVRNTLFTVSIAALSLGLAACDKKDGDPLATQTTATALAKVAPPAGKEWADVISTTPEGGYRMGNPDAPIKLIEYGSLTCPHCAEFSEKGFPKLRDEYVASGRVSIEFRNFVRDKFDTALVMLTHCGEPESFFALTEQVFANQKELFDKLQPLAQDPAMASVPADKLFPVLGERGGLIDFFAARGIAKDKAAQCLANTGTAQQLADQVQKSVDQYNIEGTPTFIMNGTKIDNVASWEGLEPILQNAGAR